MKYIQNVHTAPVTANIRDKAGRKEKTFTFLPVKVDKYTGATISTGYTSVEDADYEKLVETSRGFQHYTEKLKLLVVHDELPAEAKTPHEALVDARKEARQHAAEIKALEAENEKLKAAVYDAEEKYKTLVSASVDEEKVKGFTDKISALEASMAELAKERDALKVENEKLSAKRTDQAQNENPNAGEKNGKKGAGKDFE